MSSLFSKPKVDTKAQEAQLVAQRKQEELVRQQELEQGREQGARNRILNARLSNRGTPMMLNSSASGTTLAG